MIRKVHIVGAGNVGQALARVVKDVGLQEITMFSKSKTTSHLSHDLQPLLKPYDDLYKAPADLIILAVNDDRIETVAEMIPQRGQVVVHTSGSTPLDVLKKFPARGVIYPLQTFTAGHPVSWDNIPVFIEAADDLTRKRLLQFCSAFSPNCLVARSDERMKLHVSAVFVANFVNHLFVLAHQLLQENNRDFSLLMPLIRQTIDKAQQMPPIEAQTGPAVRNDLKTINKHLEMLENHPGKKEIYRLISQSIKEKQDQNEQL